MVTATARKKSLAAQFNETAAPANGTAAHKPKDAVPSVHLLIPPVEHLELRLILKGISPLVMRAWDPKVQGMLGEREAGRRIKAREKKDPMADYHAARHISTEGWDGVPASAFKAAIVSAVRTLDIPKADFSLKLAKMSFFVPGEGTSKASDASLVRILDAKPEVYRKACRTNAGTPYICHRPMYHDWRVQIRVHFNGGIIQPEQVINLVNQAGYWVGVGEHRPSAPVSETGEFGRWKVAGNWG